LIDLFGRMPGYILVDCANGPLPDKAMFTEHVEQSLVNTGIASFNGCAKSALDQRWGKDAWAALLDRA
jgi:hypothetical protein